MVRPECAEDIALRTRHSILHCVDDESDYFDTKNKWLSKEERVRMEALEKERRAEKEAARRGAYTIDLAGRCVVQTKRKTIPWSGAVRVRELTPYYQ